MTKLKEVQPTEAKISLPPPYNGFPIRGRDSIEPEEVEYLKTRIRQRTDIKPHMADRLANTLDLFTDVFGYRAGMDILDVGCNTGIFTKTLALAGNYVLGLDFNPRKIEVARQDTGRLGNKVRFEVADASRDIGKYLDAGSVDGALCTEVLEHVPSYKAVLGQIMRVIKPGGIFLLSVPKEGQVTDPGHINIFTKDSLMQDLQPYGEVNFHEPPATTPHLGRWLYVGVRK